MGTEPPESSEYDVWVNPTGSPFTAEWENVEDKPFETLSSDFNVQDGELHVVGGTGGASDWEDLENKPFESIGEGLSVDSQGVLSSTGGSGSPEISIGSDTPTGDEVLWINDSPHSVNVPQIDDANISLVDTWSSSKIVSEIPVIVALTQEEYDDITPDPNTYYFIYEAESSEG